MNRDQFIQFIEEPHLLNADNVTLLDNLVKEFPYCQTAELLFTKSLHNLNDTRYNSQLKIAAAYAGDRRMLYELMKKKSSSEKIVEVREFKDDFIEVKSQELVIEEIKKVEPIITETKKKERSPEEILREALAEIEERKKKEQGIILEKDASTSLSMTNENLEQKVEEQIEKEVEEKILIDNSIKEEKTIEKTDLPEEFEEVEQLKEEMGKLDALYTTQAIEASVELDIFKAEEELSKQISDELKKNIVEDEKKNTGSSIQNNKIEEIKIDPNQKLSFTDWLKIKKTGAPITIEKNISESDGTGDKDLIEEFIKNQPRISKPKTEFYNPVNMARNSVSDSSDLVTETLAKVYVGQGAYAKAISAYEILSLKYPQKSAYFAARITEIKKLIN